MRRILDREPRVIPNFAMNHPDEQGLAELAILSGAQPTVRSMTALFTENAGYYVAALKTGGHP